MLSLTEAGVLPVLLPSLADIEPLPDLSIDELVAAALAEFILADAKLRGAVSE